LQAENPELNEKADATTLSLRIPNAHRDIRQNIKWDGLVPMTLFLRKQVSHFREGRRKNAPTFAKIADETPRHWNQATRRG